MEKTKMFIYPGILALIILMAAFSRIIPHPPNFTPLGAIALFGSAYFLKRYIAFLVPLISIWLSDLFINNIIYGHYFNHFVWFYEGFYWIYGAFVLISIMGFYILRKIKIRNLVLAALAGSVIFFIVSNFGVWASGNLYPKNIQGLISCYVAGIPFFRNTLAGNLVYTTILFGIFEFLRFKYPALKLQAVNSD